MAANPPITGQRAIQPIAAILKAAMDDHVRGSLHRAETGYRQVLEIDPFQAETHDLLGLLAEQTGRIDLARASIREAIRLKPWMPEFHFHLGNMLYARGDVEGAMESLRAVIRLKPDHADAHNNLANALQDQCRMAEAEAHYREVIRLRRLLPNSPETDRKLATERSNLGMLLLATGRFDEGWAEYEERPDARPGTRNFPRPAWNGEPLGGRTLLVHAEQGFGDTLQFCRYVPLIRDARVLLEVHPPLRRLLSALPGVDLILSRGDRLPDFDLHCPLLSLPRVFGTTLGTIPDTVPYLCIDPGLLAAWQTRVASLPGLRVGLVWSGNPWRHSAALRTASGRRSMALEQLAPLAAVEGVSFVSLQKGEGAEQALRPPAGLTLHDWTGEITDFADTAALVECLDLVISVDTSVLHLAGALAKPVWLLNRFDTCWRWMMDRDDSPWYPTLRQFRQPAPGDWASVLARVADALQALAAASRHCE